MGIFTGMDLKKLTLPEMTRRFGKSGGYYYKIARAEDTREVNPNRIRKSVGAERTFEYNLSEIDEINKKVEEVALIMFERCKKGKNFGHTLTLKIKFADFKQITRSKTSTGKFDTEAKILLAAEQLLKEVDFNYDTVRLIGLSSSNLSYNTEGRHMQLTFDF